MSSIVSTEIKEVPFAVYASMHTVCVYGWPAMLLRLIEYQDWRKIGMADMLLLYTILKIVRSDTSEYAISFLKKREREAKEKFEWCFGPKSQPFFVSFETAFD